MFRENHCVILTELYYINESALNVTSTKFCYIILVEKCYITFKELHDINVITLCNVKRIMF